MTPEQRARLEEMEKDHAELMRQRRNGAQAAPSKTSVTEPPPGSRQKHTDPFKTMKQIATLAVVLLVAGSVFAADTNTTDKVKDAIAKF